MSRPIHFEIPADDPARAIRFYEKAFGWAFSKWEGPMPYWMIKTGDGPGIDGGLSPRQPGVGGSNTVVGVESIDDAIASVTAAGGTIVAPKMAVPTVGWTAYARDTEGTVFGMMQLDAGAA
jgi:predicted enzyme related to lactoylglutathione lyase